MFPLLVATRNAHKTAEIRSILGSGFLVTDLSAHPHFVLPPETGDTFEENARMKAIAASKMFPGTVLADDSGLEVNALGGAPGVYSARYAGENAGDAENRAKLLDQLAKKAVRGRGRSARFKCVMALSENQQLQATFEGVVEGIVTNHERGTGGFGYDSLFIPSGYCETFGELPAAVKNQLSHRARALEQVAAWLRRYAL